MRKKRLNLVSYFGGKAMQLHWIIPHLPKGDFHFVDMMGGGGNLTLNVDYPLQTFNDLNDDVVNLFKVLQKHPEKFLRKLYFTPYSRKVREDLLNKKYINVVDRAWSYYCRCELGYGANGSQNNYKGMGFEWNTQRTQYYRVQNWNNKLRKLDLIIQKLRHIQIESRDVFELWETVNRNKVIAYFDPPYLMETRNDKKRYKHEWDYHDHIKMCEALIDANAMVMVSGYDNELYDKLLKGYHKIIGKGSRSNSGKRLVKECIWVNYNPPGQKNLF